MPQIVLVLMCQWFAPTKLKITFEMQGKGSITSEDIESMVVRNKEGGIVSLNLPTKFVLVGNHQVMTIYLYCDRCLVITVNRFMLIGGMRGALLTL